MPRRCSSSATVNAAYATYIDGLPACPTARASEFPNKATRAFAAGAMDYIRKIDELGGIVRAIDLGYPQQEIADAAYRYQLMEDRGEKITVVGQIRYRGRDITELKPSLRVKEGIVLCPERRRIFMYLF